MSSEDTSDGRPTRREYVKYGGAVVGGGLLAGCAGQSGSGSTPTEEDITETAGHGSAADTPYEVCLEPNGCHTLEEIPETYVVYDPAIVGMMIALGRGDGVVGAQQSRWPTEYLDQLPGVSFDDGDLVGLMEGEQPDKELFYELDVDIHLIDHHTAQGYFEFSEDDVAELEENVAPFHGSWMRRPQWTDEHPYYDLYEGLNKYAEVFRAEPRGEAFARFHAEMLESIRSRLPPVEARPSIGYLIVPTPSDEEAVYIEQNAPGYQFKPLRDLRTYETDAFADIYSEMESLGGTAYRADFEVLLEADPDVVIHHNGMDSLRDPEENWEEDVLRFLQDHPVAGEVTAYQNGRASPWHETYAQGPIVNMFQTELLAKALYPEEFGEPPALTEPLSEVPEEEQLFDRQQLADIITGDVRS